MSYVGRTWRISLGLCLVLLLAVACAPGADPTATTAAAQATATTDTGAAQPTATTAVVLPTATTPSDEVAAVQRPFPIVEGPAPNPDAKFGGTFTYGRAGWPADYSGWESAVGGTLDMNLKVYDTLLENNAWEEGKDGEILANVAYDWYTDATGLQWTFKIREGIKYTDGVEFTCADAEFMIETIRDEHDATGDELRRSPRALAISRISDVTCPDDYTLEITTDGPMGSVPSTLGGTGNFQLMPRHIYEGNLDAMQTTISTGIGPFMLDEIQVGETVRWVRNPNFWNQPYPYLDAIEYSYGMSSTAREAATRVGRLDNGYLPNSKLQQEIDKGVLNIQVLGSHGFGGVQANWTRQPWDDPRFSLAMRCLFDTNKVIEVRRDGWGFRGGIFPYWSPWGLTEEEVLAVHPCQGPTAKAAPYEERVQIAKGLVEDMGFSVDNPLRPFFSMWCSQGSSNCANLDYYLLHEAAFKEAGIEVEWEAFETARAYDKAYAGEFDVQPWGYLTAMFDPDTWLYEHYYSTSDRNYGKYTNPEVDALIDLQSVTLDQEERAEIVRELSRILLRDNAKIPYYFSHTASVVQPWVKDWYWTNISNQSTTRKYTRVWLDQDAKAAGY